MIKEQISDLVTIYHADSMDVLSDIDTTTIITDPPYGMAFQSNWCKQGPRHAMLKGDLEINHEWLNLCNANAKDGGCVAMFCNWKTQFDWHGHIENAGYLVKSHVIWDRMIHGMGDLQSEFSPCHDIIWYATKGKRVFENGRPKSVLSYQRPMPNQDNNHPTCKPVALMRYLVEKLARRGDVVVDPFMGSGSTGIACMLAGIPFVGIEIDSAHYETAKKRLTEKHLEPTLFQ